jgi:hypothetical protein
MVRQWLGVIILVANLEMDQSQRDADPWRFAVIIVIWMSQPALINPMALSQLIVWQYLGAITALVS